MGQKKILNVGLPRTGTKSLHQALNTLGYYTCHYPHKLKNITPYSAACEVQFPIAECDDVWPGSKYILTTRNVDDWIASARRFRSKRKPGWNPFWWEPEEKWLGLYRSRLNECLDYFGDSGRLLLFDICAGDGWEPLCEFLGKPVPGKPFPHLNSSRK